jgi:hypothetical protein
MTEKEQILETVRGIYRTLEREVEWKLTDTITTTQAHAILNPVTRALDNVLDQVEALELAD